MENLVEGAQRWAGRTVLVTGCTGLIGARLSKALCDAGARVVGVARGPARSASAFAALGLDECVKLTMCPIEDAPRIQELLTRHRPVAVFHLAGASQIGSAQASPLDAMRINVGGAAALFDAVRVAVPAAPVVLASTTAVYGLSSGSDWNEDSPMAPVSAYAGSKAAAEIIARTYAASYGLAIVTLRCTNVYGPGDPNPARLVPSLINDMLSGRAPRLRSSGTALRDFLFVDDAVDGFVRAAAKLEDRAVESGAFNLSAGTSASALEIVQLLGRLTGRPAIVAQTGTETESVPATVSADRARTRLGWSPRWTLEDGLRNTIHSYTSTPGVARRGAAGEV